MVLQDDVALPRNALPQVPSAEEVMAALLPAYAAYWLGLVPEQSGVPSSPGAAAAQLPAQPAKQSLIRQPVGSRLPTPSVCF